MKRPDGGSGPHWPHPLVLTHSTFEAEYRMVVQKIGQFAQTGIIHFFFDERNPSARKTALKFVAVSGLRTYIACLSQNRRDRYIFLISKWQTTT